MQTLGSYDVSIDEVAALIAEARRFSMDIKSVVLAEKDAKEAGVSIEELAQISSYKKSLDKMGINEKRLNEIVQLISKQGEGKFDNAIEFIKAFPSLQAVQNELNRISLLKDALQKEVNSFQSQVSTLQGEKQAVHEALDLYWQLEAKGYNQGILRRILESAKRFGEPNQVLDTINLYQNTVALKQDLERIKSEVKVEKGTLDTMKANHIQFQYLLDMLDNLIKLGFNLQTIDLLHAATQKLGDVIKLLRGIEAYGSLSAIEGAIEKAENYDRVEKERDDVISRNKDLEANMADYEKVKRDLEDAKSKLTDLKENAVKVLRQVIDVLELPEEKRQFQKELTDSAIPEAVEKIIEETVDKRLRYATNEVFIAKFREEVRKQRNLMPWPKTLEKTPETLKMQEQKELANPFIVLKGNWYFPCSTCGENFSHALELKTVYDIKELLTKQIIGVQPTRIMRYLGPDH